MMINKKEKLAYHNLTVNFGGFYSTSLDILNVISDTLKLVSDNDEDYFCRNEIKLKIFK